MFGGPTLIFSSFSTERLREGGKREKKKKNYCVTEREREREREMLGWTQALCICLMWIGFGLVQRVMGGTDGTCQPRLPSAAVFRARQASLMVFTSCKLLTETTPFQCNIFLLIDKCVFGVDDNSSAEARRSSFCYFLFFFLPIRSTCLPARELS